MTEFIFDPLSLTNGKLLTPKQDEIIISDKSKEEFLKVFFKHGLVDYDSMLNTSYVVKFRYLFNRKVFRNKKAIILVFNYIKAIFFGNNRYNLRRDKVFNRDFIRDLYIILN